MEKALRTFPLGSSGEPDGVTPQHLRDLLSDTNDDNLRTSITDFDLRTSIADFVNVLLAGNLPTEVNEIIYGGRLMALQKKGGGIRPIAVGYMWRRLEAKCANRHVMSRISTALQPTQVGVRVSGGAEVAIHATRRYVKQLPDNHVIVKLDFNNAFNSVRRDLVLNSKADNTPRTLSLCVRFFLMQPNIDVDTQLIRSREGFQQGDPLSLLAFCDAVHPTLTSLDSSLV